MSKITVTINGEAYPCRPTMGAMLRFKRETGREVTDIQATALSDLCTYLWCCVVSACKHDGVAFDMSLMDFADSISQEEMVEWANTVTAPSEDGGEKKSPQP